MSNIKVVQASFIQRKTQKEYEQNGRDWLEIIEEEVEKIQEHCITRKVKKQCTK